jgi:2,3-bisphosphoglycerate-independent phosphoglycerate mutase
MAEAGTGRIGTVIGRFYAMDRDNRTERIEKARALLLDGTGEQEAESGPAGLRAAYDRGETDEFVTPTVVGEESRIDPERDSVIAFNFRPDRMREITEALGETAGVRRYACMTEFEEGWPYPVLFPPHRPATTLTEQVASHGLKQLHVAETEKYPHVTYFFGGGAEDPAEGEVRKLVPSPRDVATYDEKPEMSAAPAAAAFTGAWREGGYGFGIINFANADMVGHTGVIPAAVAGVEAVDACLGQVLAAVRETGGVAIVTADHGNADEMLEEDGSPDTAHSLNPVPLIVTAAGLTLRDGGVLADVAPTVLELLQIPQPAEMTGRSLIV